VILCLDEEFLAACTSTAVAQSVASGIVSNTFYSLSSTYGITHTIHKYVNWTTPNSHTYGQLVVTLSGVDPVTDGADIIIGVFGQSGGSALGAAYGSRHCIVNGLTTSPTSASVLLHEVSHLFGCGECSRYCVMNASNYSTAWCTTGSPNCDTTMSNNRHKFD